jgi:hypothetical protein
MTINKYKQYELDQTSEQEINITLKPGMVWCLYADNGPGGPCGQSMRVTCNHASLYIFSNLEDFEKAREAGIGRNKKAYSMWGVVGEFTAGGVFSIIKPDSVIQGGR